MDETQPGKAAAPWLGILVSGTCFPFRNLSLDHTFKICLSPCVAVSALWTTCALSPLCQHCQVRNRLNLGKPCMSMLVVAVKWCKQTEPRNSTSKQQVDITRPEFAQQPDCPPMNLSRSGNACLLHAMNLTRVHAQPSSQLRVSHQV